MTEHSDQKLEEYRNEHGQPSFDYLLSLVSEGDADSVEKIKSIAEDLNVGADIDTPPAELIEMIRLTVQRNQDVGFDATT